jgi:hypothetical protein
MNDDPAWMIDNPDVIPVDGAKLLTLTERFIRRFCVFPDEHALVAVTLWAVHAHMVEHFHTTPRLALLSPEAGSGKTRVLEVLDLLVPDSMFCLSASPAAIFRTLAERQITLLFDEVDTIFAKRGTEDANEDLRALLNAGYKRGASIPRCVGPRHEVRSFKVFAATALAGLGDLPDTVMTRSVIIRMKKRRADERVEPFRSREHEAPGHAIRNKLAEWAFLVGADVGAAWPKMPDGIVDRPAEVWEPLLAVADAAGGEWPQRAREACVALVKVAADRRVTLGIRLLADLRTIFGEADALPTSVILERLCNPEQSGLDVDAPWSDLHGKPLAERALAAMLKKYDIHSTKVKRGGRALQGYRREPLHDAWQRYLPALSPKQAEPVEPAEPGACEVPEVPEVPSDIGSVRCGNCAYFEPEDQICVKKDRPTTAESGAGCSTYRVPITLGLRSSPDGDLPLPSTEF